MSWFYIINTSRTTYSFSSSTFYLLQPWISSIWFTHTCFLHFIFIFFLPQLLPFFLSSYQLFHLPLDILIFYRNCNILTFTFYLHFPFSFFVFLNHSSTFCIFHVMFVHFVSIEIIYVYLLLLWLIWFSIISLINPNYHYEKIISIATCLFSYNLVVLNIF
jgi:hypothetical protein